MDSCVGAVVLANILKDGEYTIPVINHPEEGFRTRFEVIEVLGALAE
jgi:hypothetical protein